ncbi:MAG: glycosyltransferase [Anaerolineales bacterium]|nr:glycosyltransferase [Anaerolineales bacterium]
MKVTIVTISYNQAVFLEKTILSVLSQDYTNIEYIVVDPGSTDGSRELIAKYRKKIDQIIFEPDNGPADGLNKGFHAATGDIFGYLNSDDILLPNAVSQIVQAFHKASKVSVISGHGMMIDANGYALKRVYSHRFNLKTYAYGACVLVQPASFFGRDQFFQVGGFNSLNHVSWDGELWVDLALKGAKFSRIHSCLAGFRVHRNSITGSGKFEAEIQKQHARICQKTGIDPRSNLRRKVIWALHRLSDPKTTAARMFDGLRNRHLMESFPPDGTLAA